MPGLFQNFAPGGIARMFGVKKKIPDRAVANPTPDQPIRIELVTVPNRFVAGEEAQLMINEKIAAAFEAGLSLLFGATPGAIICRYREHVAANVKRLST